MRTWGEAYTDGDRYRVGACHLTDNLEWREGSADYPCSSHAHFSFATAANAVTFECTDSAHYGAYVTPVVLLNGMLLTTMPSLPPHEHKRDVMVPLPPGHKIVTVINSLQTNGAWGAEPKSYIVRAVISDAPLFHIPPVRRGRRLVIYGDSIAAGGNADIPGVRAWGPLLRQDRDVAFAASGWRRLSDHARRLPEIATRIATYQPDIAWIAIGVNDYQGPDPLGSDAFASAIAAFLDLLHARLPAAVMVAQSPLVKVDEAVRNAAGMVLADYRALIRAAAESRPWCRFVDGTAILRHEDLADGVHPHTAGMVKYAAFAHHVLRQIEGDGGDASPPARQSVSRGR